MNGRQLRLVAADDGYEPTRTAETMKQLCEQDRVFGVVGNVGTPTAMVALPYALDHRMLFYGAFTGASLLRSDPPDRYVFNYRASYAEETDAVVRYLVKVRRLKPEQIAFWANALDRVMVDPDFKLDLERNFWTLEPIRYPEAAKWLQHDYDNNRAVLTELGMLE